MKNRLYTLRDKLGGRYGQVFVFATDELALYTLRKSIPLKDVPQYLAQFELTLVGEIDIDTAEINPLPHSILPWSACPFLDTIESSEKALTN